MSKKNMFMPEHLIRDEEGNITKREDVTLVTEDYSVKTQGTTLDKKLTEITDEINGKWDKDELELGGRNYLTQEEQSKIARYNDFITTESKQENELYVHEIAVLTDVTVKAAIPVYDYQHFKEDDDITVSCDIKSTEELLVKLTQTTEDEYKVVKPNEWVRVSSKIDYGDRIGIYTENQATEGAVINIKNYKLEKGNIATPFSLAPEDESKISTQTSPLANLDHVDKVDNIVNSIVNNLTASNFTAMNNVKNGRFDNNAEYWRIRRDMEYEIKNNIFYIRKLGIANHQIEQNIKVTAGDIYYMTSIIKSSVPCAMYISGGIDGVSNHSADGSLERLSLTYKPQESREVLFRFLGSDHKGELDESIELSKPMLINLTKTFGVGNEPKLDEMNMIIENIHDQWFDIENTQLITMRYLYFKLNREIKELREMIALRGLSR